MSLNIITIGSAFYGNMDDRNLYQCMVDSKLKDKFDYINCFHFDKKFISKGVPKYISDKYDFKQNMLNFDLYPAETEVYNVYNDNIIHTFYCCNIYNNNMYLMNMLQNMIDNNEYIIISLFTGQIFLYEAINFLGLKKEILDYSKLNILCNGCYSKLNNPENYNFISNNRFFSIYFYEYYNDKDTLDLINAMSKNSKFKEGVKYYIINDLGNGGLISTYLSIINSSNDDTKNIEYLKNINRDYIIKGYGGNNLKKFIYKKLITKIKYLNIFIDLNDNNFMYIKKSIDNYVNICNV